MINYNFFEKFLHDLTLGNSFINKSIFELEKIIYQKKIESNHIKFEKHIFISCLPRSGSTGILNLLYDTSEFASLTYQNMPFILAPNLSKLFIRKVENSKKKRFHNDGVFFDHDSPEAFDQVFFKLYKDEYKKIQLPIYISLILYSQNKNKYLSKNNFNYNNFNFIKNLFPNSFFLTPFRKPLDQANSLLNQHKNFLKIHNEEKFTQRYMSYLGHEEFGKNHKPWHKPINFFDNLNINYWLEQWLLFYDFILNEYKNEENLILLSYENLNNELILEQLSKKISIKSKINFSHINYSRVKVFDNYDDDLLNKCDNLYNKLLIESINV